MDIRSDTDLGMSAQDFYEQEKRNRTGPVAQARRLADITIPSAFPPENYQAGDPNLAVTNQGINAFAVNSLASKLMLAALPPGLPMAKFTPNTEKMAAEIAQDPELYAEVVYELSRREAIHRERLELTNARWAYTHTMRLKEITGNALILWTQINTPVVYTMHQYVVKRDSTGIPIATVLEDSIPALYADDDVKAAASRHRALSGGAIKGWDDHIKVYHVEKLLKKDNGNHEYVYWQEVEGGEKVAGSEAYSPFEAPSMYPAGMIPEYGSDWYLPYALDYEGDLRAVENYAAASQDMAADAAYSIILVDPQGQTSRRDVEEADNLDVIPGREEDVSRPKSQKGGDYQIVSTEFENATRRLGRAFLSHSSVQRSGERVTAEEWQKLTAELDEALGGLYSAIAQTTQKWFVMRFLRLHHLENPDLGELPRDLVKIGVVTGLDSIGQSSEYNNLMGAAKDASGIMGPEAFAGAINPGGFLKRIFAGRSVNADGLVKGAEQQQREASDQQAQVAQQTLLEKATGPIAQEGAKAVAAMMTQEIGRAHV